MKKIVNNDKKRNNAKSQIETPDSLQKEKFHDYYRLTKMVEMMISKRIFGLKETKKSLKIYCKNKQRISENMAEIQSELSFLETTLTHIRNKSLHKIIFQNFSHFNGAEVMKIHESVLKLYEFF